MEKRIKIAIASGKGGTGKTFVATNLFNVLLKYGYFVNLVDCDAEEPNDCEFLKGEYENKFEVLQKVPVINIDKCTYCGKCVEYCNYNAIFMLSKQKVIRVLEEHCHGCGACSVACVDGAITEKEDTLGIVSRFRMTEKSALIEARMKVGVHSPVPTIKAAIKAASEVDIMLMDAPPGTSCPFIQTVADADYVVLVTEPTPFGLSDLKQSVETLKNMGKKYGVIINRAGLGNNEVYAYLEEEKIPLLMSFPFDRNIASVCSRGELVTKGNIEWSTKFYDLYNNITEQYGNSDHKR